MSNKKNKKKNKSVSKKVLPEIRSIQNGVIMTTGNPELRGIIVSKSEAGLLGDLIDIRLTFDKVPLGKIIARIDIPILNGYINVKIIFAGAVLTTFSIQI